MPQHVRTLLAIGLSLAIFYLWFRFIAPAPQPRPPAASAPSAVSAPPPAPTAPLPMPAPADSAIADPQADLPETLTVVTTKYLRVELTNVGAAARRILLTQYRQGTGQHLADLVTDAQDAPLTIAGDAVAGRIPKDAHFAMERPSPLQVVYRWRGNGIDVQKIYRLTEDSYLIDVDIAVKAIEATPMQGRIGLEVNATNAPPRHAGFFAFLHGPPDLWGAVSALDGKVTRIPAAQAGASQELVGSVAWGGVESRYYLLAMLPRGRTSQSAVRLHGGPEGSAGASRARLAVMGAPVAIPPGQSVTESFSVYLGPKQLETLRAAGANLERAIDYGWFGFAAIPLLRLLKLFYQLAHNYGVAIILLTLFIKLLLHPITKASMRSMRKMQALQPRIKELREKYKSDSQRLNAETMQLFRTHGVNPMGGCLPMLLQIPVYIALYKVLWNAIELYRAPFFGFYRDLSAPDPYFVAPILLGIAFFLQQKLTPSPSADPMQQKIMLIMPVMFTAFMIFLPSGLVLYILVNTLFSVLQQWLMNRGLGFRDLLRGNLKPRPV
ncbi:MAG: membrane protein insertase YidC [Deltaproteobacteria bacterium]|nr:membrane protein insertase YidC [Deltaproteobacteria bacterium]